MRRRCMPWLVLLFAVAALHSQAPDSTLPTFQSKVRLVLVDVVVTTGKDEPVPNLRQQDFQITENGQPQTIASFEEHKGAPPTQTKLPPMPPGVFTNYPTVKTSDSVNVLLLDWLNTQPQDQSYVHAQAIKYLKTIPPNTRLAIFTLSSRLHLVQGFTTDSSALVAALKNPKAGSNPQASPLLPTATQKAVEQEIVELMMMNQASPAAIDAVQQEMANSTGSHIDQRIRTTLQALQQLARYLSSIPGRKNVLWFSGSFPISIFPDKTTPRQYQADLQQTADLLTPSQVAIYPVSAEGLQADSWEANQPRAPRILEENETRAANQIAMEELAKDTGGQSFYNSNGLGDAMARIVKTGTQYYTLTYKPTDKKMDGSYRSIQVKLKLISTTGKYKVSYRRGYYAEDPKPRPGDEKTPDQRKATDPLLQLLGFGLPDFAQILYQARAQASNPPPGAPQAGTNPELKPPLTRYSVDFAISVDNLRLEATPDGVRHGNIELMLIAYDQNGKPLNLVVEKRELLLQPKAYASLQQVGLQIHKEIDVPSGDASLRTGIYDLNSGTAGTLEIPLSTPPKESR
jgi:VWFA-related protein